uniref:FAD-binding PCMH-type domain-containing protein n=1 Tax=Kalanchoe fedtschenkoi TaxID=63787 RepID=A0A7N0RDZ7_KALFE
MANRSVIASLIFVFLILQHLCSVSYADYDHGDDFNSLLECLSNSTAEHPKTISSILHAPFVNNASYTQVLRSLIRNRRFNTSTTPKPIIIITPTRESHVSAAVTCSKSLGRLLKIRSGGHDYDGLSYISDVPFFMLDLFNFRSIDVDIATETAWVQSGAMLGELYYRIWEKSDLHGFPAGVCPTVGVGGHLSGGGYGNLLRKYGLSVDHIIDARIVDVQGRVLDRESMGEDLFWAIRGGGGGSFGVILSFKVRLVRVPATVTVFRVEKRRDLEENVTEAVHKWLQIADKLDNNLFLRVLLQPVSSRVIKGARTIRASFIAEYLGDADSLVSILDKDFPELGLTKANCTEMSWIESVSYWATNDFGTPTEMLLDRNLGGTVNFLKRKSDFIQTPISKDGLESLWEKMIENRETGLVLNPYGGRMSEIGASETPMPHRAGNICKIQYSVNWSNESKEEEAQNIEGIRELYKFMTQFVSKSPRGAFLNYRDVDIGINHHGDNSYEESEVYGRKYYMDNFDRLVKVKTAVDPDNFFRNEKSIPTLPS